MQMRHVFRWWFASKLPSQEDDEVGGWFLRFFIEKILRRRARYYAQKHSLPFLIWKFIRKFLNVVVAPCIPFNCLRIAVYRIVGYPIGKNVFIGMRCYLDDTHPELISFEDNVVLSYSIVFAAHGPTRDGFANTPIVIRKGGYVGCAAVLLGGAVVGEGAVVAAGAVVTKEVPAGATVAGVPARVIASASLKEKES